MALSPLRRSLAWGLTFFSVLVTSSTLFAQSQPVALDTLPVTQPAATPVQPAAESPYEAGISPSEGAFVRTRDRAWSMRMGVLTQVRFSASSTPDPSRALEFVPVLGRLILQGTVGAPWLRYFTQIEFAGQQSPAAMGPVPPSPRLLDVYFEAQPTDAFGVRAGLTRVPISRQWIIGLHKTLLFDRSDANLFFRNHGPVAQGSPAGTPLMPPWDRDIGAYVFGTPFNGKLEYFAGIFNGNGALFGRNNQPWLMPAARIAINPLGRMAAEETTALSNAHQPLRLQFAASAFYNQYGTTRTPDATMPTVIERDREGQLMVELEATMHVAGVYLSAEGYARDRHTSGPNGFDNRHMELGTTVTAGWMFVPQRLELAARASVVHTNMSVVASNRQSYDLALNGYVFGNNLKLQLRYTAALSDAPLMGGIPSEMISIPGGLLVHTVGLWSQLQL
ncbi:MAG: hypothetical protein Q8Q09_19725 [Deltaproteobacteria bacterium]|nr:hypothetical protein [Deltaproteobacteria bacterium]